MKRCIVYGDGLVAPPHGFGERLLESVWLDFPALPLQVFLSGEEGLSCLRAAKEAPPQIIGKSPHRVLISLGAVDAVSGGELQECLQAYRELLLLVRRKTQSEIWMTALIPEFLLPAGASEAFVQGFNAALPVFSEELGVGCRMVDAQAAVADFLARHRDGEGDKHSLHTGPDRLTPMGAGLLARAAYRGQDWVGWGS